MVDFKKILFLILIGFTCSSYGVSIGTNTDCNSESLLYNFDDNSIDPDFKIVFYSSYISFDPDYTFREVMNKDNADVVIEDSLNSDFSVCQSSKGIIIKTLDYDVDPDFIVKISNFEYMPDFTIYNNSKFLSLKKAISLIIVLNILNTQR